MPLDLTATVPPQLTLPVSWSLLAVSSAHHLLLNLARVKYFGLASATAVATLVVVGKVCFNLFSNTVRD